MSEIKVNSIKGVSASTAAISIDNSSGTCTANITNNLSNRNLIINGAMQVAQRATSTTSIGTTLKYGVDRFIVHNSQGTAVQTATQENDAPAGFYKSLKVLCTTADTDYSTNNQSKIEYRIEGTDIQRLNFGTANAKTLAVSFYIKSNKTGNSAIGLVNNDNNRSLVHQFTIASANTWQRVSFTVAGDTTGNWLVENDNIGMRIRWGTFGTDFQTSTFDAWQAGQKMTTSNSPINFNAAINDYLQITGVQVEIGNVTDFEHRSFGQELALCQRYFYLWKYPARDAIFLFVRNAASTLFYGPPINLPTVMRVINSVTYVNSSSWRIVNGGSYSITAGALFNSNVYEVSSFHLYFDWSGSSGSWDLTNIRSNENNYTLLPTIQIDGEL